MAEETPSEKFLPEKTRSGLAICLSGGGYRAALFQCGAMRRLHELGVLQTANAFSSVSGGSIFAAFLAMNWNKITSGTSYETDIAAPFRQFVKNDIRTSSALRRLLPWEWGDGGAQSEELQKQYDKHLTHGKKLKDLPTTPRFHFCATDLAFGVNWSFTRDKVGDYQAGYLDPAPSGELPLAMAVAASSCFPPVFKPMPLKYAPGDLKGGLCPDGQGRNNCIKSLALTDGGVYDNMGLEPVWKDCATLLVCDGGKPFRFTTATDLAKQVLRINDVMGNQAEALRKRWIVASYLKDVFTGAYWGIKNAVSDYPDKTRDGKPVTKPMGYSKALAEEVISNIRTDMDSFSDDECWVLENHGYALADVALAAHAPALYKQTPFNPPCPALANAPESDLRDRLDESDDFKPLGH